MVIYLIFLGQFHIENAALACLTSAISVNAKLCETVEVT
jgi:hypothetical protein